MRLLNLHYFSKLFLSIIINISYSFSFSYDVILVGSLNKFDSIGRHSIIFLEMLYKDLDVKYLNNRFFKANFSQLDFKLDDSLILDYKDDLNYNTKVLLFSEFCIFNDNILNRILNILNKFDNSIKMVYSMFEFTHITDIWVYAFNHYFDLVIVPDEWLVDVYKSCGVKIPIYVLPLAIYYPEKIEVKKDSNIFVFGYSATFLDRKNHINAIKAFSKAFKGKDNVFLKIHGRYGYQINLIKDFIRKNNIKNVEIESRLKDSYQYNQFLNSIDVYYSISKGEGFAIPPREALFLEIPIILSDNTAHKTIIKSGFARSVKSEILEDVKYNLFGIKDFKVKCFNCDIDDVVDALKDVYNNYQYYKNLAKNGKNWVLQYSIDNLKKDYINLVKPSFVMLDNKNYFKDGILYTNSYNLYKKYKNILNI